MLNTVRSKWYELKQVIKFHQNWRGVDFSDMKSLVIFLGNPRSGTTLVRSIISAHPNAIISNELHLVKQLQTGLSWNHAVKKICNNASTNSGSLLISATVPADLLSPIIKICSFFAVSLI